MLQEKLEHEGFEVRQALKILKVLSSQPLLKRLKRLNKLS